MKALKMKCLFCRKHLYGRMHPFFVAICFISIGFSSVAQDKHSDTVTCIEISGYNDSIHALTTTSYYFFVNSKLYDGDYVKFLNRNCFEQMDDSVYNKLKEVNRILIHNQIDSLFKEMDMLKSEKIDSLLNGHFYISTFTIKMEYLLLDCYNDKIGAWGFGSPFDAILEKPSGFEPVSIDVNTCTTVNFPDELSGILVLNKKKIKDSRFLR